MAFSHSKTVLWQRLVTVAESCADRRCYCSPFRLRLVSARTWVFDSAFQVSLPTISTFPPNLPLAKGGFATQNNPVTHKAMMVCATFKALSRYKKMIFFVAGETVCYPPPKSPSCEGDLFIYVANTMTLLKSSKNELEISIHCPTKKGQKAILFSVRRG